jgi:hypothetical protein
MEALREAARALEHGDALRALGLVGREESALGLSLRGIAYAQLGDDELAEKSLQRAIDTAEDPRTRARSRAALIELTLSSGDPAKAARAARESVRELAALGDTRNAAMQQLVLARAEVLLGRLGEARRVVQAVVSLDVSPDLRAVAALAEAEIAIRSLAATDARSALNRARGALAAAPHRLLSRALDALEEELRKPIARILSQGAIRDADLFAIEEASRGALFVDACRLLVLAGRVTVHLARRPVLFALLLELARVYPSSVARDELAMRAFYVRRPNESHRSRLRVEIGRLRKQMDGLGASPVATADGYALRSDRPVFVLLPKTDDDTARIALLLGDGASWTAQSLAEHAGVSKRTAQRALAKLLETGGAIRAGKGREQRYTRPGTPIASRMLLLGLVPTS